MQTEKCSQRSCACRLPTSQAPSPAEPADWEPNNRLFSATAAETIVCSGRTAFGGAGILAGIAAVVALGLSAFAAQGLPQLKVSENHRFLVKSDGRPFFYLGDTAWELFHRLNREEADRYLENRARKGFTVIQAVAIAELEGHSVPNAYGHSPLLDMDPDAARRDGRPRQRLLGSGRLRHRQG